MLTWLGKAISEGTVFPGPVRHARSADAAAELIRANIYLAPEELLPSPDEADEFAAFFGTFLTSTFDVIEKPGTQGAGPWRGCGCPICLRIVNAPHLQPRKLYARDKRQARRLMHEFLSRFACENEFLLTEKQLREVTEACPRDVALITYCHWLVLRLSGETDGPAILALWRMISRSSKGGVLPGFKLTTAEFETSAAKVISAFGQASTA